MKTQIKGKVKTSIGIDRAQEYSYSNDIALLQYIRIAIFMYIREYKHIKTLAKEYDEYFLETEKSMLILLFRAIKEPRN